jgi:hypothetical protein
MGYRRDLDKVLSACQKGRSMPPRAAQYGKFSKPHAKGRFGKLRKVVRLCVVAAVGENASRCIFIGFSHIALHWRIIVKISTRPAFQGSSWTP